MSTPSPSPQFGPSPSASPSGSSSPASASSGTPLHQCHFCHHKPFKQEGRWIKHMEDKHAEEWDAYQKGEAPPTVVFGEAPGRPGFSGLGIERDEDDELERELADLPSNFERILHLIHPLTSLDTRITTSIQAQEQDYDSDDQQDPAQDPQVPDQTPEPRSRIELYPDEPLVTGTDLSYHAQGKDGLWAPFRSGYEFKLAKWILDSNLPKVAINRFFNSGLARVPPNNEDGTEGTCFTSAYTLGRLLDQLDPELNIKGWERAAVDHYGSGLIEFRYRPLERMIRHIFQQPSHADYMEYMPYKEFRTSSGYRMYSEMSSGRWWWDKQVR